MAGLAYHNFISAAVGIALAIAFIRGIARRREQDHRQLLGRHDSQLRSGCCCRSAWSARWLLVSQGVVQNLHPYDKATLVEPSRCRIWERTASRRLMPNGKPVMDTVTEQTIAQGPVASQEFIKESGTNGGGFFNANSAHPFENPTPLSNLIELVRIFAIGCRTDLHAGPHDRLAGSRLGGVGGDGDPLPRGCHRRLLGRGARQSSARMV